MDTRKYLVCREGLIKQQGKRSSPIRNSDYWPMIVEADAYATAEYIVELALDKVNEGYRPCYSYVVVPLDNAKLVELKPKRDFDHVVTTFNGF